MHQIIQFSILFIFVCIRESISLNIDFAEDDQNHLSDSKGEKIGKKASDFYSLKNKKSTNKISEPMDFSPEERKILYKLEKGDSIFEYELDNSDTKSISGSSSNGRPVSVGGNLKLSNNDDRDRFGGISARSKTDDMELHSHTDRKSSKVLKNRDEEKFTNEKQKNSRTKKFKIRHFSRRSRKGDDDYMKDRKGKTNATLDSDNSSIHQLLSHLNMGISNTNIRYNNKYGEIKQVCIEIGHGFNNIRCVNIDIFNTHLICNETQSPICGPIMSCKRKKLPGQISCGPSTHEPLSCHSKKCSSSSVCLIFDAHTSECVRPRMMVTEANCHLTMCPPASHCLFIPSSGDTPSTAFCFLNRPSSLEKGIDIKIAENNAMLQIILRILMRKYLKQKLA